MRKKVTAIVLALSLLGGAVAIANEVEPSDASADETTTTTQAPIPLEEGTICSFLASLASTAEDSYKSSSDPKINTARRGAAIQNEIREANRSYNGLQIRDFADSAISESTSNPGGWVLSNTYGEHLWHNIEDNEYTCIIQVGNGWIGITE